MLEVRSHHCVGNCPSKLRGDPQGGPRGYEWGINNTATGNILVHMTEKKKKVAKLTPCTGEFRTQNLSSGFCVPPSCCSAATQLAPVVGFKWKQDGSSDFIPYIFSDSLLIENTKTFPPRALIFRETY